MNQTRPDTSGALTQTFAGLSVDGQAELLETLGKIHAKAGGAPFTKPQTKTKVNSKTLPRPFLKWAGGKQKVLPLILPLVPERIGTYYEPFVGGGAVFFELKKRGLVDKAVLSDANDDLITTYAVIRDRAEELIKLLTDGGYVYDRLVYLAHRAAEPQDPLYRAARMIYLNKTCFNGLYRLSKRHGKFNSPFGKFAKDPVICDAPNIRAVSHALRGVTLKCCSFADALKNVKKGDLVYMDPPYMPVSRTSSFTSYTSSGFGEAEHRQLAAMFARLASKGVSTILSNSVAPLVLELYPKDRYHVTELIGSRNIGGPASYRKPAREILVSSTTPPAA